MKSQTKGQTRAAGTRRMVPSHDECRCGCGNLLARVVAEGLEIKCRKCKGIVLIAHEELVAMYQKLAFRPLPFAPPPPRRD